MKAQDLVKKITDYNPNADVALITKAFNFAKKAHEGQVRDSGEPYFEHPLGVALILTQLKVGSATISAALLHDVVEETHYKLSDIKREFGDEVAGIVEGLTNLDKRKYETREEYKAENIRKILLATTKDIRIMLIKLCDRLHNMRTLETFSPEKQKRIAQETLDIYAPIAHKLGIWFIKGELEDLSLRYMKPEVYTFLKEKISEKRHEREKATERIIANLRDELKRRGLKLDVYGRAKYFYSIYKKMLKKNLDLDEIYDLIAVRIITRSIPDCYTALGVVHELWTPVPRRFKDYIANPKTNGYQSLHTIVRVNEGRLLEVQIRTEDANNVAEHGIAAHWRYKGTDRDKWFDRKISWIKQLLEWKHSSVNGQDFIETLKLDLFDNEIVAFTPKGDPIKVPEGGTPVDFAYGVHTNIGEHTSKALVNGKVVPLNHKLKPGDIVEIITSKNAKPSRQWLNFVMSSKARAKIKSFLHVSVEKDTKQKAHEHRNLASFIEVDGKQPVKLSKCCDPHPGDEIVAFHTKDKKITVHKAGCPNVYSIDPSKKVAVRWTGDLKETVTVRITLKDGQAILTEVLNLFVKNSLKMRSVNTRQGKENLFNLILEIEEPDPESLDSVITLLRDKEEVINVVTN
ncbi:MAG: bifunctional (p)ppGpp synthetase/guanosine-3',5'-bis(diphosphate) 3'-pyrophosphohydrolase [Candidatus Woesearchaeota archaeon]